MISEGCHLILIPITIDKTRAYKQLLETFFFPLDLSVLILSQVELTVKCTGLNGPRKNSRENK